MTKDIDKTSDKDVDLMRDLPDQQLEDLEKTMADSDKKSDKQ